MPMRYIYMQVSTPSLMLNHHHANYYHVVYPIPGAGWSGYRCCPVLCIWQAQSRFLPTLLAIAAWAGREMVQAWPEVSTPAIEYSSGR